MTDGWRRQVDAELVEQEALNETWLRAAVAVRVWRFYRLERESVFNVFCGTAYVAWVPE